MNLALPGAGKAEATSDDGWSAGGYIRWGMVAVLLLGGGFGGWAATASLAGAVIATGQLRAEANRQVVQHPDGGVVGEIMVRDGDVVRAGDTLVRLDASGLESELAVLESQLYEIIARRGRLEAEQSEAETITFDQELLQVASANPKVRNLVEGQKSLFFARQESMESEMQIMVERESQLLEQIAGADAEVRSLEGQRALIAEELAAQEGLEAKGLALKNRVLALQREAVRMDGQMGSLVAEIARLRGQISELGRERLRLKTTRREEAISQSRELGFRELELAERRIALRQQLERLDITSPRDGQVIDMTVHALKSVIRPAEPVLFIVPSDTDLVVDSRIEPLDIDSVSEGQETVLRLSSLNSRTTPEVFGRVYRVSRDSITDEQTGLSFYRAEIRLDPEELAKLDGQELIAGMPVEVYIQTGTRTPIEYLVKPIWDYIQRAGRQD